MDNLWLKIRVWTKIILFSLVMLYVLLFVYNNSGKPQEVWLWFGQTPQAPMIVILLCSFLLDALMALVVRMVWRTVRQLGEMRSKSTLQRHERELAEMKAKSARLRTSDAGSAGGGAAEDVPEKPGT
jgi:uncharacterized integral membrane protein